MTDRPQTVKLLAEAQAGDRPALDALYAQLYDELRRIAHHRLLDWRRGDTLDTTALVHEAYLRLMGSEPAAVNDRAHFLALASRAMRFVLVDYARARTAGKRGGSAAPVPLDSVQIAAADGAADLLALEDALGRLTHFDARLGELIEYRFFGGLTFDEIAAATGRSVPTVKRDWTRARAWLHHSMQAASP